MFGNRDDSLEYFDELNCPDEMEKKMDEDFMKREFSDDFVKKMRHRVEMSYHKYGSARDNFGAGRVDALKTAELCLYAFKKDHNTEHLIDAANYLMFRYKYPMTNEFFKSTGSSESVGTVGTPINMEK